MLVRSVGLTQLHAAEPDDRIFLLRLFRWGFDLSSAFTTTVAQLKHSNARARRLRRADVDRTSIGAWQFGQKWLSILLDVKQKSESAVDISCSLTRFKSMQLQTIVQDWNSAHSTDPQNALRRDTSSGDCASCAALWWKESNPVQKIPERTKS